jgi:hypothetical protein
MSYQKKQGMMGRFGLKARAPFARINLTNSRKRDA